MDEPSEGLAPQIVAAVKVDIRRLKEQGLSIVLVEQNAKLVFEWPTTRHPQQRPRAVEGQTAELNGALDCARLLGIY